jgi:FKBP-type peptidyl-prolyl cis-trans isomerase FkpA
VTAYDRPRLLLPLAVVLAAALAGAGCDDNGTGPSDGVTELQTIDLVVGTGATAGFGHVVTVHYTGWLYAEAGTDKKGSQFDTSRNGNPFTFLLGAGTVIRGWDFGIAGMRVGGQRRLIIPSSLGYGSQGYGPIPPNTSLVFDVELVAIQ